MKKKIILGVLAVFLLFLGYQFYKFRTTPPASPPDTATFSHDGMDLSVNYSRPYKKGRLIFGEESEGALQPYGQYWRVGANAATELTVSQDFTFGGEPVPAGTYRLFAFPGASTWDVVLNSETGVFLAFLEPDYEKDVLKVQVTPQETMPEVEQLTINFDSDSVGVNMNIIWDKTKVSIPISAQ